MVNGLFVKAGLLAAIAASSVSAEVEVTPRARSLRSVERLSKRAPPTPTNDAFYKFAAGDAAKCASQGHGTLLETRKIDSSQYSSTFYGQTFDINQNVAGAYQIRFCSHGTDANGAAEPGVATALIPYNAPKPARLLVFQSAENSASKDCAPSFKLRTANAKGDYDFLIEQLFMNRGLGQGYIVLYTDHEGPNAAFSAGKVAAHHVLDATTAILKEPKVVTNGQAKIQFFGYSGGALATAWAVQEQGTYADNLTPQIVGAGYGGIPVNPKGVFTLLNKSIASGVAFAGLAGLGNVFPAFNDYINQHARENGTKQLGLFRGPPGYCLIDAVNNLGDTDVFTLFDQPAEVLLEAPAIKEQLVAGTLGNAQSPAKAPKYPIRIFQAQNDQIVVTADVDNYVDGFCAKGANLLYVKETLGEHQLLSLTGTPAAFKWVDDRFNGIPANQNGCTKTVQASTLFSWDAYLVFGQTLINQLLTVYNAPVGPLAMLGEQRIKTADGKVATNVRVADQVKAAPAEGSTAVISPPSSQAAAAAPEAPAAPAKKCSTPPAWLPKWAWWPNKC